MSGHFLNKRFNQGILLAIVVASFLILPFTTIAKDVSDISSERVGEHLQMKSKKEEAFKHTLIQVFSDEQIEQWSAYDSTARERAVPTILKGATQKDMLTYLLIDAPVNVGYKIVTEGIDLARIAFASDISVFLERLEKKSAKEAAKMGEEWLFRKQIRTTPGTIEIEYEDRNGNKQTALFQYVLIYKPTSQDKGKLAIRIYSTDRITPPRPTASYGMGLPNDLEKPLPPFTVTINGTIEKVNYGAYDWTTQPDIEIEFPENVPDLGIEPLGFWERHLVRPVKSRVGKVEVVVGKVTGDQDSLIEDLSGIGDKLKNWSSNTWNGVKSGLSQVNPLDAALVGGGAESDQQDYNYQPAVAEVDKKPSRELTTKSQEEEKEISQVTQEEEKNEEETPAEEEKQEEQEEQQEKREEEQQEKGCVALNGASKERLQQITGVGPATADKIVNSRDSEKFYAFEDLTEVSGIGPVTADKIKKQKLACIKIEKPEEEKKKEEDSDQCIALNKAPEEKLQEITGIGEVTAGRLIDFRQAESIYSINDLKQVSGIGPATVSDIKSQGLACVEIEQKQQEKEKQEEQEEQEETDECNVNVNTASEQQLQEITGIGPAYAERIADNRNFASLDDLTEVRGIGEATLENIKEQDCAYVEDDVSGVSYSSGGGGGTSGSTSEDDSGDEEANNESEEEIQICSQEELTQATTSVVINEVAWMGNASSSRDEWVELNNISSTSVSLSGWQLIGVNIEDDENNVEVVFEEGTIATNTYFLLERSNDETIPDITADKLFTGWINNNDYALRLFDKECRLHSQIVASSSWPAGSDGEELRTAERSTSSTWYTSNSTTSINGLFGTPKAENSSFEQEEPKEKEQEEEQEETDKCNVNINTASEQELRKITGIGSTYDGRVVDNRNFASLNDLTEVNGIGKKTLEDIKEQDCAYAGSAATTTISTTTYLEAGEHEFDNLIIEDQGELILNSSTSKEFGGVKINADTLKIESEGIISADEQGYAYEQEAQGPGGGDAPAPYGGTGAGYGGRGGKRSSAEGGRSYGSLKQPTSLGSSGGGYGEAPGGTGGGAIWLDTDEVIVNGTISTDGEKGKSLDEDDHGGGGSGGSVYIETGEFNGSGIVQANGGAGSRNENSYRGSGGAGGRIALHYDTNDFSGSIQAFGGEGFTNGGAGTILKKKKSHAAGNLIINNNGYSGANTLLNKEDFRRIRITGKANVILPEELTISNLFLSERSQVKSATSATSSEVNSGEVTINNSNWNGNFDVSADNFTLASSSIVSANGQGFGREKGPGKGKESCGGAGFGGRGESCGSNSSGATYGSYQNPSSLGSGGAYGGGSSITGGSGGGKLKLDVEEELEVNGALSANGEDGDDISGDDDCGGGSGGSILIETNTWKGSGSIAANGGVGFGDGGSGAGGRIAVYYRNRSFATNSVKAQGGKEESGESAGGAGTIFLKNTEQSSSSLIIDNNGGVNTDTVLKEVDSDSLKVLNGAQVILPETLGVDEMLRTEGGVVVKSATSATTSEVTAGEVEMKHNSKWRGNFSINADNLSLHSTSIISANGKGFPEAKGPGAGREPEEGAGHGGIGGNNASSSVYGSSTKPTQLGSGGDSWGSTYAGAGGGKIKLSVTSEAEINGDILVNGTDGGCDDGDKECGGGGSGGSILIDTDELSGSGLLQANGGNVPGSGGAGAGGRIAVHFSTSNFGTSTVEVKAGSGGDEAESGSIFWGDELLE